MQWSYGAVEAATVAAAGADPNAERSGQGRSGWTAVDRHNGVRRMARLQTEAKTKRNGPAAAHARTWCWSLSTRPGKEEQAAGTGRTRLAACENLQQAIRDFSDSRILRMAFCASVDFQQIPPAIPPPKAPPAPTDLIPAGLESAQQPYASHRQSPSPLAQPGL